MTVIVPSCMVQQVSAQGSLTARLATHQHSRTSPVFRSSAAPAGSSRTDGVALPGSTAFSVAASDPRARSFGPIENLSGHTVALATDPFPFVAGIGDSYAPSAGFRSRDAGLFDLGPEPAAELDQAGAARFLTAMQNRTNFFPLPSIYSRVPAGSALDRSSSTLFSLATLSGMLRGDFYLPFGPSVGGVRFDYDDKVRLAPKAAGLSDGAATAMFTSSSALLRNRMTFSTGAMFGVRSSNLTVGGGVRRMASAAQKSTVPSLALRLSF